MKKLLLSLIGIILLSNLNAQDVVIENKTKVDSIDTSAAELEAKFLDSLFVALFSDTASLLAQSAELAGKWEDDNKNWERAFGIEPSPGIKIVHSLYWRSPHFMLEHEYFFQLGYDKELESSFFAGGDLVKMDSTEYENIRFFLEKPKWFVPDKYENYDIWRSSIYSTYFLFIDKVKKRIFFTEFNI